LDDFFDSLHLHYGDMTDALSLIKTVDKIMPDEIYNLAAQSHVKVSFDQPEYTTNVDALGVTRLLDITHKYSTKIKFYQASTSEMYGRVLETPQNEKTPFNPVSPYGISKVYAHYLTRMYREAYGVFACSVILFNHESPRRGETFVTRKIVRGLSCISTGQQDYIALGNLDAKRDWGHAADYVRAMWLMLQQDKPNDYVIATGKQYSVREFVETAAPYFGLNIVWVDEGIYEKGIDFRSGKTIIKVEPRYFRPAEVDTLLGDATKARFELGWNPEYTFEELVEDMVLNGQ
jgi:GDPmannose 4,6-dehydratase